MGCNQSKAASGAVLILADEGIIPPPTGLKMSSSTSPSSRGGTNPCSSGEGADLTPNATLSSDDNDVVLAVLSNDTSTPKSDASPSPLGSKTTDMGSSPQEAPTSLVQKEEAPSDPEPVSSSCSAGEDLPTTTKATESPQSPKSPRRRRRRSNSGGVKAMQELAVVEDEEGKTRQQVHVQPALQPVAHKNVEMSIPEKKVETSTPPKAEEQTPSVITKTEDLVEETVEAGDFVSAGQAAEITNAEEEKELSNTASPENLEEMTMTEDTIVKVMAPVESEDGEMPKSTEDVTLENSEVSSPKEVEQTESVEEESPKPSEEAEASPSTASETLVEPSILKDCPDVETATPKKEEADKTDDTEASPETPSKTVVEPVKMNDLSDVETTTPKKERICAGCSIPESECGGTSFKYCARCKVVAYCGRSCQIGHWKQHKKVCGGSSLTKQASSSHLTTEAWEGQRETTSSPSNVSAASSSNNTEELFREHLSHHESPMSYSSGSRASIHEEAVRELEAVLRRLRSNDPDLQNSTDEYDDEDADDDNEVDEINKSLEEINVSLLKSPSPAKSVISESNNGIVADEAASMEPAVLQSPSNSTVSPVDVHSTTPTLSPLPSSPRPFDENTPILLPPIRRCAGCSTIEKTMGAFKDCAKCRSVIYCNKKCQKGHWKEHKKTCCKTDSTRMSLSG